MQQLKKSPSQILILSLLLSSEAHHDELLKSLNESHVPEGIATKYLEHIVGQIAGTNTIIFNKGELLPRELGMSNLSISQLNAKE